MNQTERARRISLLAKAPPSLLREAAGRFGGLPEFIWMRRPETGLAMVRARAGGTGDQFNLGEMSVTRCALKLRSGEVGVAYVAGRDKGHAELAALFDAVLQSADAGRAEAIVLRPIADALAAQAAQAHARAQATRVEFMTMARGDD